MRPTMDQVLAALGPAAALVSVRVLDVPPQRLARLLWRRALRKAQPERIALKAAAIRLLGMKGGAR